MDDVVRLFGKLLQALLARLDQQGLFLVPAYVEAEEVTSASHRVQLMDCQRFSTAGDAHMACTTLH